MRPSRLDAAVVGLFLANGLSVGAYVGSLPALQARLGLSPLGVSALLLVGGVCALVAMQLTGRATHRWGARRFCFVAPVVMALGLAVLASAPVPLWAGVGAGLYGIGNGMMDVAMNAVGVAVEQRESSARMGLYHGSWSLGSFGAAIVVHLLGRVGLAVQVWPQVAVCMAAALALVWAVGRTVPETAPHDDEGGGDGRLPAITWLLGAMALAFALCEGTGMDWAALHTVEVAHVDAGTGALGLAALSACMVGIRFAGDAIVRRLGRARVVLAGSAVAALGYVVTLLAPLAGDAVLPVLLVGWGVVGLGVGVVAPQIYGVAGHLGGPRMLAVVVGFGYTSFLAGPAVIGLVAERVGLRWAMLVPMVAAVSLLALATRMPDRE